MTVVELGQIVAQYEGVVVITVNGEGLHLRSTAAGYLSLAWPLIEEQPAAVIAQKIAWWANSSTARSDK